MEALTRYRTLTAPIIASAMKKNEKKLNLIPDVHARKVTEHAIASASLGSKVSDFVKETYKDEIKSSGRARVGTHMLRAAAAQTLWRKYRNGNQTLQSFQRSILDHSGFGALSNYAHVVVTDDIPPSAPAVAAPVIPSDPLVPAPLELHLELDEDAPPSPIPNKKKFKKNKPVVIDVDDDDTIDIPFRKKLKKNDDDEHKSPEPVIIAKRKRSSMILYTMM